MIKNLTSGPGVIVNGGNTTVPWVPTNSNNPMQGMIRISGNDMQVFDGSNWINLSTSYATVSLDQETQDLLIWARAQRQMALNRMTLAQNNPSLMKALEKLKKAEDNFDILQRIATGEAIE